MATTDKHCITCMYVCKNAWREGDKTKVGPLCRYLLKEATNDQNLRILQTQRRIRPFPVRQAVSGAGRRV